MELKIKIYSRLARTMPYIAVFIFMIASTSFQTQRSMPIQGNVGPENGYLVITGGGKPHLSIQKIIQLLGKKNPTIIIIPTADADANQTVNNYTQLKEPFLKQGITDVAILHTRNRDTANSERFLEKLRMADAVWISGGRQWRLADAYLNTKVIDEMNALLKRGGVIAGSSAGATILGSFMVRGDTKSNTIMEGDHTEAFGFLKNSAIDQHVLQRNRHFDLLEIHTKYPELLCIGLDESTSVVVHKNEMEVFGPHYVTIFDGTFWWRDTGEIIQLPPNSERFYFLKTGDKYDLSKRKIIKPK